MVFLTFDDIIKVPACVRSRVDSAKNTIFNSGEVISVKCDQRLCVITIVNVINNFI